MSVGGGGGTARAALGQPGGEYRAGGDHAVAQDACLEDMAIIDQRGASLPDPALDQPFRQGRNPPI